MATHNSSTKGAGRTKGGSKNASASSVSSKFKKQKYEEELMQIISSFLRKSLSDQRLTFVSITKIELNNDYSEAKVYWDTFDTSKRGDAKSAISGIASRVRHHLAQELSVRQVPMVKFIYDAQYDAEQKIAVLLDRARSSGADE
ncbi:MAG: 30S ribosome-binding factor RbfA [Oligoflexia bacterium]|nr:30S ribosome-binding factor RbfA [Oligoflexia bacterium]MBF0366251.1 30S ribosome-binding factor RbfA [Oligoflexia bacterium]